jgi:lysophospholipase L1-like esterase
MAITPGTDYEEFPIPTADAATNASEIRSAIGAAPLDVVTNTAVNTAIATNSAATRAAAGIGSAETISPVPLSARFVFEGDSITNPNLVANPTQTSWVPHALTLPNLTGRGTSSNVAVSGSTYTSMIARYAASVYPLRPTGGETVYLFTMIGSNDGGTSSATWISALESYWTTAKGDGFTVVGITTPIHSANPNTRNFAAAVRGSSVPDIIVDLGKVFRNSTDSALWLVDALHPTSLGAKLIAEEVNRTLDAKSHNPGFLPAVVASNGIGVGTNFPRGQAHLVGDFSLVAGQNETANTIRTMSIGMIPYGNPATDNIPGLLGGRADSTTTTLYLGRAAPSSNVVCTSIDFFTGANNTTTGGTLHGRVGANGKWTLGSLSLGGNAGTVPLSINDTVPGVSGSTTSGGNTRQSWVIARPAADGNIAVGSLSGELVVCPESDKSLAFATVSGTSNFQIVRMRIKPSGVINTTSAAIPNYADDAAADAALQSGDLYTTTAGGRTVYRKP